MFNKISKEIEKSILEEMSKSLFDTSYTQTETSTKSNASFAPKQLEELIDKIKPDKYLVFVKNEELKSKLENEFDSNVKIIIMDTGDDATIINLTKAPEWIREMLEGEYL